MGLGLRKITSHTFFMLENGDLVLHFWDSDMEAKCYILGTRTGN